MRMAKKPKPFTIHKQGKFRCMEIGDTGYREVWGIEYTGVLNAHHAKRLIKWLEKATAWMERKEEL